MYQKKNPRILIRALTSLATFTFMLILLFLPVFSATAASMDTALSLPPESALVVVHGFDAEGNHIGFVFGFAIANGNDGEVKSVITSSRISDLSPAAIRVAHGEQATQAVVSETSAEGYLVLSLSAPLPGLKLPTFSHLSSLEAGQEVGVIYENEGTMYSISAVTTGRGDKQVSFAGDIPGTTLGSPLFLEDGSVAGIVTSEGAGTGIAVSIDKYMGSNVNLILIIGIAAAAVLAILVVVLLLTRKRAVPAGSAPAPAASYPPVQAPMAPMVPMPMTAPMPTPMTTPMAPMAPTPTPMTESVAYLDGNPEIGATWPLAPVENAAAPPPTPPSALPPLIGIRGASGQYAAMNFPVRDKTTIGRDPSRCSIIFEPRTPGVSALHCEVVRQGQGLQLIDRGSSCGTFIVDGQKLEVNVPVPLASGQMFYLGERRNAFSAY